MNAKLVYKREKAISQKIAVKYERQNRQIPYGVQGGCLS